MCPRPLQGRFVIRKVGLYTINLCIKFEVSTFTHYENKKSNATCRNWGGLKIMGCLSYNVVLFA